MSPENVVLCYSNIPSSNYAYPATYLPIFQVNRNILVFNNKYSLLSVKFSTDFKEIFSYFKGK